MNKIIAQNFPEQAKRNRGYRVSEASDDSLPMWQRALAALKVEEEEFILRYKFAKENGDDVHAARAKVRLTKLREAMQILEFSLHE